MPPTVFLSAATVDLKEWRDVLDDAFRRAGFHVLTQEHSLGSALGDVKRLLADTVAESDCIIHLAGQGYGSDATDPFPDMPAFRCSWTQFEYYHAHREKKDVIAFACTPELSKTGFIEIGDDDADRDRKRQLQEQHWKRVASGKFDGTPLAGSAGRTCNERVDSIPALLKAVAAAVGTLHKLNQAARENVIQQLQAMSDPLKRYFFALSENFSTYENLGLPPPASDKGEEDKLITIRQLFVEPTCTAGRVSPEEFDAALLAGKNPAAPLLPLLAGKERRSVLLADPGMGKSMLIQWLITTLAEEATLPAAAAGLRGAIPLPFILRDLVRHLPADAKQWDWPALLDAFQHYHPRAADRPALAAALTGDEAYFRSLLASDRAFFLIDGLDEIGDPAHRRALRKALWQGFEQYPKARWLITSRWVGYEEAEVDVELFGLPESEKLVTEIMRRLELPRFSPLFDERGRITSIQLPRAHLLYLAPFDDTQQLTFARHWYLPRMGEVLGAEHAGRFVEAVRQNSAVRVIGRVPNLLYLLALLYRHRAMLPHGRTHVYSAISEAYLGGMDLGIDAARGQIDAHRRLQGGSEHKDKVRLLATIARHMQKRRAAQSAQAEIKDILLGEKDGGGAGDILATRGDLEQWLAPHFPGDEGCAALHAFIGYVAARSGLLLPRGEGLFGFAHLSFQEYYAACWLEEEFGILLAAQDEAASGAEPEDDAAAERATLTREQFADLAAQPAWREPLVFLVEKLSASAAYTRTVLRWLFPQLHQPAPVTAEGRKRPPHLMPIEAARLLSALSLDPQVALTAKARQTIWEKLWSALLAQHGTGAWHLSPTLLATSEFQPQVWAALAPFQPRRLDLRGCTGVTNLAPLAGLGQLKWLSLHGCTGVADLTPLADLAQLEFLSLHGCTGVANLSHLASLVHLKRLSLNGCTGVADLSPLACFTQLTSLYLIGCTGVGDVSPIRGLTQLQTLDLRGCMGIADLAPLRGLTKLQTLVLDGCSGVGDHLPLSGLTQLHHLALGGCLGLANLASIAGLTQLQVLFLDRCTSVTDLSPLASLTQLQKLDLEGCTSLSAEAVAAFRKTHPKTKIIGT